MLEVKHASPSGLSWARTKELFDDLGKVRDAVLVFAGLTYLFGFSCWQLYAYRRHLGLLQVFEAQYVLAGLVPVLCIGLGGLMAAFAVWTIRHVPRKRAAEGPITVLMVAMALAVVVGAWIQQRHGWNSVHVVLAMVVVALWIALVPFLPTKKSGVLHRSVASGVASVYGIGFIAVAAAYGLWAFDFMPSELGGPRARVVAFDVKGEQLSPETRSMLGVDRDPASAVVRSRPVRLVFEGGEFFYFFPTSPADAATLVRLRRDLVQAVVPVDTTGGRPRF